MIVAGFPPTTGGGGSGLVVSITPSSVSASGPQGELMTTNAATASASGGTPPYSYSWSSGPYTVNSPTSATTTFSKIPLNPGTYDYSSTCSVTDSASGSGSDAVGITFVAS